MSNVRRSLKTVEDAAHQDNPLFVREIRTNGGIVGLRQPYTCRQHPILRDAGVNLLQVREASHHESRTRQQDESNGDLSNDECVTHACPGAALQRAARGLESLDHVCTRGLQRRRETHE